MNNKLSIEVVIFLQLCIIKTKSITIRQQKTVDRMRIKCVAHLAYYMFAAVGVAAEVTVDATSLRLNALEETVSTLAGAVTKLSKDNDLKEEVIAQMILDNDAKEEAITSLKENMDVLRNELNTIRSRRTTSTTSLNKCLKVEVVGEKKKLIVKCDTDVRRPTEFRQGVKITDDVRIIKGNLMITNGRSFTNLNGKGNLIIGESDVNQKGSHNIVLGLQHTFSSYGGFVAGKKNTISGPRSTVSGGYKNTASGDDSTVSGGNNNIASGVYSIVSGGEYNTASGDIGAVRGGRYNSASGPRSAVSGGFSNTASGDYSTVSGGYLNKANGLFCAVSGGNNNIASGDYSVLP